MSSKQLAKPGGQTARNPSVQTAHFSVEEGLSDRIVSKIQQDRQGCIWVATNKGLSRFNGYDFLNYDTRPRNPHKIRTAWIGDLELEKSGKLMLFYHGLEVSIDLLDPATGRLEEVKLEKEMGAVRTFCSPEGSVYVLFEKKHQLFVSRFDEQKHQFQFVFELPETLQPLTFPIDFLRASDGSFWFSKFQAKNQAIFCKDSKCQAPLPDTRN